MALPTNLPSLHGPTQSEQFFGGFVLAKSINQNQNKKLNWICSSCGCDNMGKSTVCGLCGALHSKYDENASKASSKTGNGGSGGTGVPKNQGNKLLISREVFKKCSQHFPAWNRYTTIAAPMSASSNRVKHKPQPLFDFDSPHTHTVGGGEDDDDYDSSPHPNVYTHKATPNPNAHLADFIETVFDDIDFENPFGVHAAADDVDDDIPTIVSDDEDIEDLPLDVAALDVIEDDDADGGTLTTFGIASLTERLNANINVYNKRESTLTFNNRMKSKHVRQQSFSVPSSPKTSSTNLRTIVRINRKEPPLLMGVVHVPSPSRKDRVEIVLQNVKLIVKHAYDGAVLINHGYSANALVPIIRRVHNKYPSLWLAANFLGVSEKKIFKFLKTHRLYTILKGVWCENSGLELLQEELDDIFIHSFHRKDTSSRIDLHYLGSVDDTKECDSYGFAVRNLLTNALSDQSGSNNGKQLPRRVTFTNTPPPTNGHDDDKNEKSSPRSSSKSGAAQKTDAAAAAANNSKRDDRMARNQLLRMRQFKFDGLYFGGVDLTPQQCIKIPSQKSIRTRRRTYSVDVERGLNNNKDSPRTPSTSSQRMMPRSYSAHTGPSTAVQQRLSKHRNITFESRVSGKNNKRSKSHKNGASKTLKKPGTMRKNGHKANKRSSSQGLSLSAEAALADLSLLHTADNCKQKQTKQKQTLALAHKQTREHRRLHRAHTEHDEPRDLVKLNMLISSSSNTDDGDMVMATIAVDDNNRYKHKNHQQHKHKFKPNNIHTHNRHASPTKIKFPPKPGMHKAKSAQAKNNPEKTTLLKKTRSHDRIDTKSKPKPHSPTDSQPENGVHGNGVHVNGGGGVGVLVPGTPSTSRLSMIHSDKALQNVYQHTPLDNNMVESVDLDGTTPKAWITSIAMDAAHHLTEQLSLDRTSSSASPGATSLHSYSSGDEIGSVYSHMSHTSASWSEFGSVSETLDDYFEALHRLGTFASNGYMHVMTTSGKGPNIEIKLKALSQACHKKCLLAVASGVRMDNLQIYVPFCDILMVSTCISNDFHHFDDKKMAQFKKTVTAHLQSLDTL